MADGARQVRIFVSSPGDARFERSRLERVIERLNGEFAGVARLSAIRWETEFYKAHRTFQAQIPEAAQCDIVVAIFRSRLGTELPADFPHMENGEPYPSGTALPSRPLLRPTISRRRRKHCCANGSTRMWEKIGRAARDLRTKKAELLRRLFRSGALNAPYWQSRMSSIHRCQQKDQRCGKAERGAPSMKRSPFLDQGAAVRLVRC